MSRRDEIITSPTAARMLETVTPIYDEAYTALWIYQVMGQEYDAIWQILEELPAQLSPETATWGIELWERRYGIVPNSSLSISQRRQRVLEKRKHSGPISPQVFAKLAQSVTGLSARVEEHDCPYTFDIYLTGINANEATLRRRIKAMKQSHMSFDIRYEESVTSAIYTGISMETFKRFELKQVN